MTAVVVVAVVGGAGGVGTVVVGAPTGAVVGLVLFGACPDSCGEPAASAPVAPRTSRLAAMVAASAGRGVIAASLRATSPTWTSAAPRFCGAEDDKSVSIVAVERGVDGDLAWAHQ